MLAGELAIAAISALLACGQTVAQEATRPAFEPYVAEVATETLNVRSGPSTNYYVVIRLKAGATVRVVGAESGWLAVEPPDGCFSLIAGEYVDRSGSAQGVVKGDNVRVRAGSELSSHNYAVQAKLSRGTLLTVLGEAEGGWLKIAPPHGAKLWVSGDYVQRVPEERLQQEPPPAAAVDFPTGLDSPPGFDSPSTVLSEAADSKGPATGLARSSPSDGVPDVESTDVDEIPGEEYRRRLTSLDAELTEQLAKPLLRRDFAALLTGYGELAEQEADEYTRAYSRVRIQQIESAGALIDGLRRVEQARDEIREVRKDALTERSNLRPLPILVDGGFDAEGELRTSALYDSPAGPRRYRLVDPRTSPARTLGYVEIPLDSGIDPESFLGRRVGVRAKERVLQTGDVNPIAIYVAAELKVLDRFVEDAPDALTVEEDTRTASPTP
ncbi:MAG: SH3 domain-containing protein [bacterium]|nr:SH3 domain-containing protein [bacterium]